MNSQKYYTENKEIIDTFERFKKDEINKPLIEKCKSFVGKHYYDFNFVYYKVLEIKVTSNNVHGLECISIWDSQLNLDDFQSLKSASSWTEVDAENFNYKLNKIREKINLI